MGRRLGVALTTAILSLANHASAQTPEERAVARDLIAKHGDAVVFVLGTTKIRINQGGKEVPNPDQRLQSLVTLLDSTATGAVRWGADSLGYFLRDGFEVRPLGGGRSRRPVWSGAPASKSDHQNRKWVLDRDPGPLRHLGV